MRREGLSPDVIASSPAERAKQTALAVKKAGALEAAIFYDERIYEASPNTLREVASAIDDAFLTAMLVGHNPGMEGFIRYLTGEIETMATAALAVIDLKIDAWADLTDSCGNLRNIYRPKDIASD